MAELPSTNKSNKPASRGPMTPIAPALVEFNRFYQEHYAIVASVLAYALNDIKLAERATAESMASAYEQWEQTRQQPNSMALTYRDGLARAQAISRSYRHRFLSKKRSQYPPPFSDQTMQAVFAELAPDARSVAACSLVGHWATADIAIAHDLEPHQVEHQLSLLLSTIATGMGSSHDRTADANLTEGADASRTLRNDAQALAIVGPGPGAIRHLAVARRRSSRLAFSGLSAAAAALVAIGAFLVWPDGTGGADRGESGDAIVALAGTLGDEPVKFSWDVGESDLATAIGFAMGDDGVMYTLSTAPADESFGPAAWQPNSLYRSKDGGSWEYVPTEPDNWITDLGVANGVLYGLGTAPGGTENGLRIGQSKDGGDSWDIQELPSTATPPDIVTGSHYTRVDVQLATSGELILAALTTTYEVELFNLIGGTHTGSSYPELTENGVVMIDSFRVESCSEAIYSTEGDFVSFSPTSPPDGIPECEDIIVETIPWSDLGISGLDDLVVHEFFISSDGKDWEAVDPEGLPPTRSQYQQTSLEGTGHGFVMSTISHGQWGTPMVSGATSTDGKTWKPISIPGSNAMNLVTLGDTLVAVDGAVNPHKPGLSAHVSTDGGTTWTESDLTSLVPNEELFVSNIGLAGSGPLGAGFILSVHEQAASQFEPPQPSEYFLFTSDGISWSITSLAQIEDLPTNANSYRYFNSILVTEDTVSLSFTSVDNFNGFPQHYSLTGTPTSK